ncbi:hypothetical protein LG288_09265 [Idiomarina seosinensis]|uniref:hypothetical protein n=1 Tax=Idiomarina seosinensis TaxID=281739 RepID=UPI003850CE56
MESTDNSSTDSELAEIFRARFYRNWWQFQYANRYFLMKLSDDRALEDQVGHAEAELEQVFIKLHPELAHVNDFQSYFYKFANCLVYEYHISTQPDGFLDVLYHLDLLMFDFPLRKLESSEITSVKILHEWTYRLGFLSPLLLAEPEPLFLWEVFVEENPDIFFNNRSVELYEYPKKDDWPQGLKVSTIFDEFDVSGGWDLAIFYHKGDVLSKLSSQVKKYWNDPGLTVVGEETGAYIKLYVDRSVCSHHMAKRKLEELIEWCTEFESGRIVFLNDDSQKSSEEERKRAERRKRKMIRAIESSEGLKKTRWSVEQSNLRRAVGLYHWDCMSSTGKELGGKSRFADETIEDLRAVNIRSLNYYRTNYKRQAVEVGHSAFPELGDSASVHQTVNKEMRNDYFLTDYCIRNADFFTSEEAKKNR